MASATPMSSMRRPGTPSSHEFGRVTQGRRIVVYNADFDRRIVYPVLCRSTRWHPLSLPGNAQCGPTPNSAPSRAERRFQVAPPRPGRQPFWYLTRWPPCVGRRDRLPGRGPWNGPTWHRGRWARGLSPLVGGSPTTTPWLGQFELTSVARLGSAAGGASGSSEGAGRDGRHDLTVRPEVRPGMGAVAEEDRARTTIDFDHAATSQDLTGSGLARCRASHGGMTRRCTARSHLRSRRCRAGRRPLCAGAGRPGPPADGQAIRRGSSLDCRLRRRLALAGTGRSTGRPIPLVPALILDADPGPTGAMTGVVSW